MKNAVVVHGAYGNPEENWIPWLRHELEKKDYRVYVPQFPTPDGQNLANWFKIFETYKKYLSYDRDIDNILIGHSIGASFILSILERLKKPVQAAFLVSGFIHLLGDPMFDQINKTFVEKKFDWDKIKKNCQKFFVFHSDDDPYVPLKYGEEIADKLDTEVILVHKAGHFNAKTGYTRFDLLLDKLNSLKN